ncbi:putative transmembrane protein [Toxoplasma gondii TgCatPRC2]|uniref:Transmembrane protein n=7 Tax=Toxoplasma gondii TaxID=5811 RepID=A0A125YQC0_TOXGV|nr:hypothetical protein TGME49_216770 [Toxoplasma gondii ME49]ESS28782.1 putative transmembrane protein [Toxoplasma gondii VEG]KFG32448.1 putative transmembrane protein [Toxoplasma gondii GAB2-2007-GAL-DOM2]KFG41178.1 putative transmembrane protein [Toxoplasma gondii FOU]KYF38776.1 hypothetical protein TGARI_216770 [Toxoplasma gondii ARI]KYK64441.1 putative transmembrane protein [Toxoplasma gondii TgCatPRC2]PUA83913.1 putative transmembrane protein [Toxoplasma gondii TgCATBr9]|eukprot:XP_018635263.1 hypothetical protein TGME49_216770 [Toxoplasma gondii ME49]
MRVPHFASSALAAAFLVTCASAKKDTKIAPRSESSADPPRSRGTALEHQVAQILEMLKILSPAIEEVNQRTKDVQDKLLLLKEAEEGKTFQRQGLKRGLLAATFSLTAFASAVVAPSLWDGGLLAFVSFAFGAVAVAYLNRYFRDQSGKAATKRRESKEGGRL